MAANDAKAAFGLTKSVLAKLPIMITLPGKYTSLAITYKRRRRLVSQGSARQAAIMLHGGESELAKYMAAEGSQTKVNY